MKAEVKAASLKQNLMSQIDGAKSLLSDKLNTARASALTKAVDAGERLMERQIALLGKLKERAAQ
jgi:hypothetical protein